MNPLRTLSRLLLLTTVLACRPTLTAADESFSMPLLQPSDLVHAHGVRLEVQLPTDGLTLYDRDPASPELQTPMATRRLANGTVQVWYLRVDYSQPHAHQLVLCLGELRDGQWTLPTVCNTPLPWDGPNNVVMTRSPHRSTWGGFNPFQIVATGQQLQMLYWDQPDDDPAGRAGGLLAMSADGTAWEKLAGTVFTETNDFLTLMHVGDEFRLYQTALQPWPEKPFEDNIPGFKRVITLRTSTDNMQTWTPQNVNDPTLAADEEDPPETEFYGMKPFACGDGYAAVLWKYYADPEKPGEHSRLFKYELAVSRNGLDWQRPYRDTDLAFWSFADPFLLNEQLCFVTQGVPGSPIEGDTLIRSWPRDRMVAATGDGHFTTRPFARSAGRLALNAMTSSGSIDVTLCDGAGQPIRKLRGHRIEDADGVIALPWETSQLPAELSLSIAQKNGARVFGITTSP